MAKIYQSLILLFFVNGISAQSFKLNFSNQLLAADSFCTNMDFEEGSFNGWELFRGTRNLGLYNYSNITATAPDMQHFITTAGMDSLVPVSKINPDGGVYSVMLGDSNGIGAKAASLKQTFLVDSFNTVFSFSYAVVLENPGHAPEEQPYFTVRIYDTSGTSLPCGDYKVTSGPINSGGDPDFIVVGGVSYKDWTTNFVNLDNYIGQNITIEYIVGDCEPTGHFGYAYIDGNCSLIPGITTTYSNGCGGFPVYLDANYYGTDYLWSTGDTTQNISINTSGAYSVTVSSIGGCANVFSVNIPDSAEIIANFSFDNLCMGNYTSFSDLSTANFGNITGWQWDFGDGSPFSPDQNPQHFFNSPGIYNVNLAITTDTACIKDTTISILISDSIYVTINPPSVILCEGDTSSILATVTGGVPPYSYTWSNGDTTQSIIVAEPQLYEVTVTDENGCVNSESSAMNFFSLPMVSIGNDTTICEGCTLPLDAGNTGSSFLWNTGETTQSILIDSAGEYSVTVTDINGCSGNDTVNINVVSTVAEKLLLNEYYIYPNPANEKLFIQKNNSLNTAISVYNVLGERFYYLSYNSLNLSINISSFPKGIYFLHISDEKSIRNEKIIIE